jgi:hypothetical protein
LILVTNDSQAREIPVDMHGRIMSDITISPSKLFIGVVRPGQKVTKNLIVRGKSQFKILEVDCGDDCFKIEPSTESKSVHLIKVVYTAGDKAGRIAQKISLRTDHGDVAQAFTAFAEVVKPDSPAASSAPSGAAAAPAPSNR